MCAGVGASLCPYSVCDSDPSKSQHHGGSALGSLGGHGCGREVPGPASGPASTHRAGGPPPCGTSMAPPTAARPSWEGAYLCSPNLESIEAEWLHFKRNYYKPFRECEFQNEISLSKLSLMCRCCVGIGLRPCL